MDKNLVKDYLNLEIILSNLPGLQNLHGAKEKQSNFIVIEFIYSLLYLFWKIKSLVFFSFLSSEQY